MWYTGRQHRTTARVCTRQDIQKWRNTDMEYKVSEKVQKKFDTLTKDAKVQKALQFMEEDRIP